MKINKLIVFIILVSIIATAFFYKRLPEEIALHFNYKGEVDRWGGRNSIWLTASLPLLLYGLLLIIPRIDPRKDSFRKHTRAYSILANATVLFLIALNWFSILYSIGYNLNIQIFILTGIGILWIIIGNYLPNARQNYTFGIRTPWTLANETSWTKTHRLGGIAFIITGIIALAAAFIPGLPALIIFFSSTLLMVGGLFLYSYVVYRKSVS